MVRRKVLSGVEATSRRAGRPKELAGAAAFLKDANKAVRADFGSTVELSVFRQIARELSRKDRLRIVEQALVLFEQNYVHLPLKRAMHAVNPVQQFMLLQDSLRRVTDNEVPPESEFHRTMIQIFMSVRDLHTNYILPSPYNRLTAFLPFLIEPFFEGGRRRYLVSFVTEGFSDPPFEKGVEVVAWNGILIERAVEINGNRYAGSNLEARHARGVSTLTVRPLITNLPPDEDWVNVTYIASDGQQQDMKTKWLVFSPSIAEVSPIPVRPDDATMGYDVEMEAVAEAKRILFAPQVVEANRLAVSAGGPVESGADNLPTSLPKVFQARVVNTGNGTFSYVRIRTFGINPEVFISEFIRLLSQLPDNGLILDVRSNGGGQIAAGEQLLQLFTPRRIEPEPAQFINSSVNLRICERHAPSTMPGWEDFDLSPYLESMRDALRTGSTFSNGVPITPASDANALGQQYDGPVVLITDALCFSTTDIFAAGFQDHEIGPILGVHHSTGAGGANVWEHSLLKMLMEQPTPDPESPYKPLPGDTRLRVAIRRTLRVGKRVGTLVEDLGVAPDKFHEFTRNDLLSTNVDLINHAALLLKAMPKRRLKLTLSSQSPEELVFTADTKGLDRLDVYGDGRPEGSIDITDGETEVRVPNHGFTRCEFQGYVNNTMVIARRIMTGAPTAIARIG